ncbi:MAG: glycoside hydrolase family 25 [Lachnospiraceae bacterium]|nr:glycoside hydrolase family 25 [Lachnospiraceae bacterium]
MNHPSKQFDKKIIFIVLTTLLCLMVLSAILVLSKKIHPNNLFITSYPVRGVDVSHYQGTIDWASIEEQNISFAFIKATEGSSYVDGCFSQNWKNISNTSILAGAYHFFSFDSAPSTQASLYIETVGSLPGKLPPVIDVEYYGDKEDSPPDKDTVTANLQELLNLLEEYYHVKPIIYTTYSVYDRYIKGIFDDYPLWIRNVYYTPNLDIGNRWTFWQYSDTEKLNGYTGEEPFIDLNVFHGTPEELQKYIVSQ